MIVSNSVRILELEALTDVVITPSVREVAERALAYLRCGFPVNFSGPAGTGKTTMALLVARELGRPVVLLNGNERMYSTSLIGGPYGYRHKKVVDNYIRTVSKVEEEVVEEWVDSWLSVACRNGYTLLYDEFTRSRPEANNALLSVLEERILILPVPRGEEGSINVHPNFAAIFTSNPEEYAGVFQAQDALLDRMATIKLDYYDQDTEASIVRSKTGLESDDAEKIVRLVRFLRQKKEIKPKPSLRAALMIGRMLKVDGGHAEPENRFFLETCLDVLAAAGTSREKMATLIRLWFKGVTGRHPDE